MVSSWFPQVWSHPQPVVARRSGSRLLVVVLLAVASILLPTPVAADPAGPTDFETSIVSIDVVDAEGALSTEQRAATLDSVSVTILGGDSFVQLTVEPGQEVRVPGYRREPYLWFKADGTVVENERSPARWLNEDRYSEIDLPDFVDVDAEPEWVDVATDGTFAWHDHRAHWMNGAKPLGAVPGDAVVDDFIVLHVGGDQTEVRVAVRSVLLEPPSPVAALAGAMAGFAVAAWGFVAWRTRNTNARRQPADALTVAAAVTVGWSLLAAVMGYGAVLGLPAEAAPGITTWALPAVGSVALAAAVVAHRWSMLAPSLSAQVLPAALLLAGVELVLWATLRRQAVTRSLIPTELPMWLDRAAISGALVVGLVALVLGGLVLLGVGRDGSDRRGPHREGADRGVSSRPGEGQDPAASSAVG